MPETVIQKSRQQNIVIICGMIGAIAFIPLVSNLLISKFTLGLPQLFYSRLSFWIEVLLLFIYAHWIERQNFLLWTEKRYNLKFYISSLLALFLLQIAAKLIAATPLLLGWHDNFTMLRKVMTLVKSNKFSFMLVVITAGFTEELIFRGYIQSRLALFFNNKYVPIIITSVLFSALHYKYFSLVEILFTFLFGLITAAYYQKYLSIGVLIVLHVLIDYLALALTK
jgi:membrane protease YdiL (CAAX protease family)